MQAAPKLETKTTILIVDDSRTVRAGLSKILSKRFSIVEAVDGEDGWNKLKESNEIRLVVTDIMMPKLDGYGLICRIRGTDTEHLKNIPIIVVTSAEDEISRERAHACGANNFIVKPAKETDLLERVNFHTESFLNSGPVTAPDMAQYQDRIENTVIEAPSIEEALDMLLHEEPAALFPYASELAIKVLPLLEFCNEILELDVENEIETIRQKLGSS